jgi:hypothetical protein
MTWNIWKISVLVIITPKGTSFSSSSSSSSCPPPVAAAAAASSSAAAAAAAAAAIALKFHSKHVTNKNKTKHIMKISHINVNIYDKTVTSQQNSDYDVE